MLSSRFPSLLNIVTKLMGMLVCVSNFSSPSFPVPPGPLVPSPSIRLLPLSTLAYHEMRCAWEKMLRKAVVRKPTAQTTVPFPPARVNSKNQDRLCHCHTVMPHCLV
ncbi:hypothetical protein B0H65DRAFT_337067 [Neurospora tetraspora]|uniref:Secreted protein n=1 Tax=Neurospora tetraspora TaxID=94610 RepID=A0AAE0J128_9PEZI|nr:hypothetical protein B0H65DRAFT_337067 [Neurospora tetraspora]